MTTRVAYWDGASVEIMRRSDWRQYPKRDVLWVDLAWGAWRQRLQGRDHYWVDGLAFGAFNDPENLAVYGGDPARQASAWRATPDGSEPIHHTPPARAHALTGVQLPDDVWEEVSREHPLLLA